LEGSINQSSQRKRRTKKEIDMAMASDIMKGGFNAGQAKAIGGQVAATVTAAGTIITDATDLTASISVITTATDAQGVQLVDCEINDSMEICNLGGGYVYVYPPKSTASINQLAAGAGFVLANNTAVVCRKYTATKWMAFLSA